MFALPTEILTPIAAIAGLGVAAVLIVQLILEKIFGLTSLIPEPIREERGKVWLVFVFVIEIIMYAVAPTLFYYWIYTLLPFFSYRAGIAVAIFLYIFGTLPFAVGLATRIKLPGGVLTFSFFFNILKLAVGWGTVTYLMSG